MPGTPDAQTQSESARILDTAASDSPQKRKRASRKGQPRKFQCLEESCGKSYTRAEHLARHQLNHSARHLYRCDTCNHTFVRPDLYARHTAKHRDYNAVSQPDDRRRCSSTVAGGVTGLHDNETISVGLSHGKTIAGPYDTVANPSWIEKSNDDPLLPTVAYGSAQETLYSGPFSNEELHMNDMNAYNQPNDSFATWLFDSPDSQNAGFDFSTMPFMDFGMESWQLESDMSHAPNTYTDASSTASITGLLNSDAESHIHISQKRRDELITVLSSFMCKKKLQYPIYVDDRSILVGAEADGWPNLTPAVFEHAITSFWSDISGQIPVIHRPTFTADTCETLLLFAIIALGVGAQVKQNLKGSRQDYRAFADFIATNLRWEVFIHDEAQPPVHLWVAQTLLLLELYEKMFSSRQLHERAYIHHASTLTLLRRGNPMTGGRSGSETPPNEVQTGDTVNNHMHTKQRQSVPRSWWHRWVAKESMNRVVFVAFEMDTLHANLFGHPAEILPQELRLQLPCDESLWNAQSGEEVQQLDSTLAMYGIKPLNFLDGLKQCLHGSDVQTHRLGRLILMSGLLSVSWHVDSRDKHLQFVEVATSVPEQVKWKSMLLRAFDNWRQNFAVVLDRQRSAYVSTTLEDPRDPDTLYHAIYIIEHLDIIDVQLLSAPKRLLGRNVSQKDRQAAQSRLRSWARTADARRAVIHAYKVIELTLWKSNGIEQPQYSYSARTDTFM